MRLHWNFLCFVGEGPFCKWVASPTPPPPKNLTNPFSAMRPESPDENQAGALEQFNFYIALTAA